MYNVTTLQPEVAAGYGYNCTNKTIPQHYIQLKEQRTNFSMFLLFHTYICTALLNYVQCFPFTSACHKKQ